jgi:TonB family protein
MKVLDVNPAYPPNRLDATATVHLEGRIAVDGFVKGVRAIAPADPDFAAAAIDAIGQWQFAPTRLDGVTIETVIKVTVHFNER